jgi:hypothetical protein
LGFVPTGVHEIDTILKVTKRLDRTEVGAVAYFSFTPDGKGVVLHGITDFIGSELKTPPDVIFDLKSGKPIQA